MRRLLIVDDHAGFRAAAARLLAAEGFEIVGEAENGVAGLRKARELVPDVVLLDVGLPDFDGFEVAERLARLEMPPAVVLTSSRERTDFASLIGGSSAHGFVPKSELSAARIEALLG
jgi:DNA-binding NarL/FixJ family response regulator